MQQGNELLSLTSLAEFDNRPPHCYSGKWISTCIHGIQLKMQKLC